MMQTLIQADDHLALWTFVMVAATSAIFIERRYKWASKIPGAVITIDCDCGIEHENYSNRCPYIRHRLGLYRSFSHTFTIVQNKHTVSG